MKSRLRTGVAVLVVVLIILVSALVLHTQILASLGIQLVKTNPVAKADTVLVLDGDVTGRRILTAAQLVRDGYAPQVLVSGSVEYFGKSSSGLAIDFAVARGFPEGYFVPLESHAKSTDEEARAALPRIRQMGFHRVLLVTSDYHTRRASGIYRSQAPDITFITIAAPDEFFTPGGWWHNREGRKTFLVEWEKTIAVWLGGL